MSDDKDGKGRGDGQADASGRDRDGLLSDLAGRILRVGAEAVSVGAEKLREKGESAASLTARGKEEVMTLLANEIRSYIEKLKVGDEVRSFLDDYTLEINASVRLKSLHEDEPAADDDGISMEVGLRPNKEPEPEVVEPEVVIEPEPARLPEPAVVVEEPAPKKASSRKKRTTKKTTTRKRSTKKSTSARKGPSGES